MSSRKMGKEKRERKQRAEEKRGGGERENREKMKKEREDRGKEEGKRRRKKGGNIKWCLAPGFNLFLSVLPESPQSPFQITWCMKNSTLSRPMVTTSPD